MSLLQFKATAAEKKMYNECANYLKNNYTPEQLKNTHSRFEILFPFLKLKRYRVGCDDIGIIFMIAKGEAKI